MDEGRRVTLKVRIEGHVQGVGFRAFVASLATGYNVREVWNTRDGAVEAILQSESKVILDEIVERLDRGPGRVDRVTTSAQDVDELESFEISHTR